jgi:hypothetical protein
VYSDDETASPPEKNAVLFKPNLLKQYKRLTSADYSFFHDCHPVVLYEHMMQTQVQSKHNSYFISVVKLHVSIIFTHHHHHHHHHQALYKNRM